MATRTNRKPKVTEESVPILPSAPLSAAELQDRIAARAYEIYLARNGASGDDLNDWLTAEHEICATFSNTVAFADNVVPITSATSKRKRASTTQTAKSTTAGSSTLKQKTASAPRTRKRKEVSD